MKLDSTTVVNPVLMHHIRTYVNPRLLLICSKLNRVSDYTSGH